MDETNAPDPKKQSDAAPSLDNDPLDLGFGDDGLEQLIGSSTRTDAEELFKDLTFGDDEEPASASISEHLSAPASSEPEPALPAPVTQAPMVPEAPQAEADLAVREEDMLAAMDALELDAPALAAPAAVPALPQAQAAPDTAGPASLTPPADPTPVFAAPRDDTIATDPLANDFGANDFDVDDPFPPFEEFEHTPSEPADHGGGGVSRSLLIAFAGILVVGVGGIIGFGMLSGDDGTASAPQVIAASEGEDKVEPAQSEETPARPGDAAFEALEGEETAQTSAPRVVLPAPNSGGLPLRDGQNIQGADIAPAAPGSTASRAVRTVTVRADGTVVETNSATATAPVQAPTVQLEAGEARPVEVVAVTPQNAQTPAATADPASTPPVQQLASQLEQAAERVPTLDLTQPAQQTQTAQRTTPPAPVPAPAQSAPTQLAAAPVTPAPAAPQAVTPAPVTPAPVTQAPAASTPAQPVSLLPASVPAGDFIVQLASLRSDAEARATFTNLQNRFGSILGGFGPNIQRADLGERGIYHRVRIGPMDRAAADSVCQRYQSAGGDCFVQRQ